MRRTLLVFMFLLATCGALAQTQLPLQFKGKCDGRRTNINDRSVIPDQFSVNCGTVVITQIKDQTVVAFFPVGDTTGDPELMFAGKLRDFPGWSDHSIGSFFTIDSVNWGGGIPTIHFASIGDAVGVRALHGVYPIIEPCVKDKPCAEATSGRECFFRFSKEGWDNLTTIKCDLDSTLPSLHVTMSFQRQ